VCTIRIKKINIIHINYYEFTHLYAIMRSVLEASIDIFKVTKSSRTIHVIL
jgi:hypothetical protein